MSEHAKAKPQFFGIASPYPISRAARAGDFVFTSGFGDRVITVEETSYDLQGMPIATGRRAAQSFEDEAHATFKAVREALEMAGSRLEEVIDCQVWLRDPRDFLAMNRIYSDYFKESQPVRSVFQNAFMFDFRIELKVIAYSPKPAEG